MSKKHKGADTILYNAETGTLVTSGTLDDDSWYRIKAKASSGSALPGLAVQSLFCTPKNSGDAITLAEGDEVWPVTLTEVCKADVEISGEKGIVETTDSCDYPYVANLPDGFTNLSGSINTLLRFDEDTEALIDVTLDFLSKFYDIVEDDGEGTYTLTSKNDDDLLLMILLNKDSIDQVGEIENWIITPAVLSGISQNIPLKDALKGDYSWSKGQGPASIYKKTVVAET
jgi:hypothetical protein